MATIQTDLAQIRTAIYGRDVREAIADGIEHCYKDGEAVISRASSAATNATAAVSNANTAVTNATAAVSNANTAVTNANAAKTAADAAVTNANAAKTAADAAATNANAAANKIKNLTATAETGAAAGATVTSTNNGFSIKFTIPKGEPFSVSKTFESIAAMNAYKGTDIKNGDFVIIASNTEDVDNAKVFVKNGSTYNFVTDLSGAQGIKGDQGIQGVKGDKGDQGIQGVKGDKGDTGDKGDKGDQGIQGVKGDKGDIARISSRTTTYQESTSGTTVPTGNWKSSIPTVSPGNYLWIRAVSNWNNGDSTTEYSVSRMGIDGTGAVSSVAGIGPDENGNIDMSNLAMNDEAIRTAVMRAFDSSEEVAEDGN